MTNYIYVVMCEHNSRDGDLLGISPFRAFYSEEEAKTFADKKNNLELTSVQNREYYVEGVELGWELK